MTGTLLLDNSAWARLAHPKLPPDRLTEIADALEHGQIVGSLPFLLEAGYSARNARDHGSLIADLLALPQATIDEQVERRAIGTRGQLARACHHRLPPVDIILAALADRHGFGILHYDADYDLILAKTNLQFDSVWLAERGTI